MDSRRSYRWPTETPGLIHRGELEHLTKLHSNSTIRLVCNLTPDNYIIIIGRLAISRKKCQLCCTFSTFTFAELGGEGNFLRQGDERGNALYIL